MFTGLACSHEVHCLGGAYEEIGWCGEDQGTGSAKQGFVDPNAIPQALLHGLVEVQGKFAWCH